MSSAWAENGGVRLHFLDSGGPAEPAPILFVPGLSDVATEYAWLLDAWRPRRGVIVDLRGRGRSDAPATGYRPVDHAGDIAAVLAACAIPRVHLVTFSRGTSYALTWALAHPDAVAGLVVGDYQAVHIGLRADFPAWWMGTSWRGRPMTEIMRPHVIEGIQRDSFDAPLWDRLAGLSCPVMLVRGARGIVDEAALDRWRAAVPGLRTETFEASAHDLFKREGDRFARVVRDFADHTDAAVSAARDT